MIGLHPPSLSDEDLNSVLKCLKSSWISSGGPDVELFEQEFAAYTGAKFALSTCSGTSALHIALETLKRIRGIDKPFDVICPTLTFIATANSIVHAGGTPVFVDSQSGRFGLDQGSFRQKIENEYSYDSKMGMLVANETKRPLLAVMPAHLMGEIVEISEMIAMADDYGFRVIEDAAEALGCKKLSGEHVGLDGLVSIFSFNANKILTTGGGGMVIGNDIEFMSRCRHLSTTAKTDAVNYEHDEVGYNYRLVNILAALGRSQLKRIEAIVEKKAKIVQWYSAVFEKSAIEMLKPQGVRSNNWLSNIVFEDEASRNSALDACLSKGIQCRPLWLLCHRQKAFDAEKREQNFDNAESLWQKVLSLPTGIDLTYSQVEYIANSIINSKKLRDDRL